MLVTRLRQGLTVSNKEYWTTAKCMEYAPSESDALYEHRNCICS